MADINVPGYLESPLSYIFTAIYSVVGDASPIPMSVQTMEGESDTTRSVLFKAKIHVDRNKRTEFRDKIVNNLNTVLDKDTTADFKNVLSGTKNKPDAEQFDVVVRYTGNDKPQVIRILVKPTGGGSGGGAVKTKVQEVGQALFLAIRYIKDKPLDCHPRNAKTCLTTSDYAEGMKYVDCNNEVSIDEIMSLEQSWKETFILGANRIYQEVGGSGWRFVRGDSKVEAAISAAFNRCKSSEGAPVNEDKWNPSDIWMVKEKDTLVNLLAKEDTIDCLNNFINQAFSKEQIKNKAGDKDVPKRSLVGLSLKKLGPTARWKIMNEIGKSQLDKAGEVKFNKNNTRMELTAFSGMDVYLVYGRGRFDSFQCRNFGGDKKGDWKLELKGKYAAQGKIQGEVMRQLLRQANFSGLPSEPTFNECKLGANNSEGITNELHRRLNGKNAKGWTTNSAQAKAILREKNASWRYSKLCGLRFLDWLEGLGDKEASRAMKEMYLYASSQTDKSSVHYKLY
tara:strand:- start:1862 stop:3388 length:1527 start_codon:yes stop_codon:yes gene_type:complete